MGGDDMKIINHEPHIKLHEKIKECGCKPWRKGVDYCKNCEKAVIDLMNKYGAGYLCRDEEIELMLKSSIKLVKENESLKKKLDEKIKRVEELKTQIVGKVKK